MAGELSMNISKEEREWAINRSRRMYQSDMDSNIATALEKNDIKWQSVVDILVAEKDALIAELEAQLANQNK